MFKGNICFQTVMSCKLNIRRLVTFNLNLYNFSRTIFCHREMFSRRIIPRRTRTVSVEKS